MFMESDAHFRIWQRGADLFNALGIHLGNQSALKANDIPSMGSGRIQRMMIAIKREI